MTTVAPATPPRMSADLEQVNRLRAELLAALIALLPLAQIWSVWADDGGKGQLNRSVVFAPFDAPLVGLLVLYLLQSFGRHRRLSVPTTLVGRLVAALVVVAAASIAVHPSPRGFDMALRLASAVAVADAWRRLPSATTQRLLGLLLGVGSAQGLLAMVQSWRGRPFGVNLVDYADSLYRFGNSFAGRGGLNHPYHLCLFLLAAIGAGLVGVARARNAAPWIAGLAICAAGVGVTYSRASLLGAVPVGIVLIVHARSPERRVLRAAVAAAAVGFVVAAVVFGNGWYGRVQDTQGADPASGRVDRWTEAIEITTDNPVLGVGLGRYTMEVAERTDASVFPLPADNVVAHAGGELGFVGAAIVFVLGGLALVHARRRGPLALAPVLLVAPFFLLDHVLIPTGIATAALVTCLVLSAKTEP